MWVCQGSNLGPRSYQERVLPLNYTPKRLKVKGNYTRNTLYAQFIFSEKYLPKWEVCCILEPTYMTDTKRLQQVNTAIKRKFKDKKLVFGYGAVGARIVFVGEAPGSEEEREGKPMAGSSAKLLNQLLRSVGIDKRKVYLTNVLKYSAIKTPTPKEIKSHVPFLKEEIKTVGPQIVVTLGSMALNGVGLRQPVENIHGRVINFGHYELLPTFHPESALKNPQIKILLEADFLKLKELLKAKPVVV